jgi:hypothetical protein
VMAGAFLLREFLKNDQGRKKMKEESKQKNDCRE